MKVPNILLEELGQALSLSRLQNEGSQLDRSRNEIIDKSIKATE